MSSIEVEQYRVRPDSSVDLKQWSTDDNGSMKKSDPEVADLAAALNDRLEQLQELFYADGRHSLLVVIQATDTGGKDGTIRRVFDGTNPQGVKVASFKRPTDEELAHDYLWRVHAHAPKAGDITIFNRSHYEDVLVVRVHNIVPEQRWEKRYRHIREFEKLLIDEGTTIVKVFLHISKDEQKERLQERLGDPQKHWKFELGDLREREHWDDYQDAFAAMLEQTSTESAPWYAIPSDRKWYRNLVISQLLIETLESLNLQYPESDEDLTGVTIQD